MTLGALLVKSEPLLGRTLASWRPRGKKDQRSNARQVCELVYGPLLGKPASTITPEDLAAAHLSYKRRRPQDDHKTANGQVGRARAYLSTVFNWASGPGKFCKVGMHRSVKLSLADVRSVVDPSVDDPTIAGERERVLDEQELGAVLPLLRYPAPAAALGRLDGNDDLRPIALRFKLYTMSLPS